MKTKPMQHQLEAFNTMRGQKNFALFMEQGTGKTKTTIMDFDYQYQTGAIDRVLVIAPNGVHRNWLDELNKHCDSPHMAVAYSSTMGVRSRRELDMLITNTEQSVLPILTMNVEAFSSKKAIMYATNFCQMGRTYIVVDESSRIKTPGAKRTKELIKLGKLCLCRRILTGTPVTNSPLDVFSQFAFLDNRILGHRSYYAFRARYAVVVSMCMGGRTFQSVKGYRNMEELTDKVAKYSYRCLKQECLDLPDKVYSKRYVELGKEQARIYKSLVATTKAEIAGAEIKTQLVLTKLLRLQQVVGGFVADDDGNMHTIDDNKRIGTLMDVVCDVHGKCIVWARFTQEIIAIEKALQQEYGKDAVVSYYGATTAADRDAAVQRLQSDSTCRFFVANPHAAGIGLTLTAAETTVYYSHDFSLETRLQSEDRNHRHGTKNTVRYIDLVASDTVDEKVLSALIEKKNFADIITQDVSLMWL